MWCCYFHMQSESGLQEEFLVVTMYDFLVNIITLHIFFVKLSIYSSIKFVKAE